MTKASQPLALGLTGAAIGWLIGQSATPLLQTVLTGILAVVAAVIAAMAGVPGPEDAADHRPGRSRVTAWPLAALLVCLCLASAVSTVARFHGWLGPSVTSQVDEWARLGIPRPEVAYRLFATELPDPTRGNPVSRLAVDSSGVVSTWTTQLGVDKPVLAQALLKAALDAKTDDAAAQRFDDHQKNKQAVLMGGVPLDECAVMRQRSETQSDPRVAFSLSPRPVFKRLGAGLAREDAKELLDVLCPADR